VGTEIEKKNTIAVALRQERLIATITICKINTEKQIFYKNI
jgi:hypothetical protein